MELRCNGNYFKEFCKEINKYTDNVHELNLGANIEDINTVSYTHLTLPTT